MANNWLDLEEFDVKAMQNRTTGQWLVISDDIPGLYVHGNTLDEVQAKTPGAIEEMFRAMGRDDVKVAVSNDGDAGTGNYVEANSRYRVAA